MTQAGVRAVGTGLYINTSTEKRLYFLHDLGRQNARFGAKHTAEAHPPIPLESLSES